jgi:hypothetical protein
LMKIDLANGNLITRFAGGGNTTNPSIDGQNSSATFCGAMRCSADYQGNIFVTDSCYAVKMVNQTGYVTTLGTNFDGFSVNLLPLSNGYLLISTLSGIFKLNIATKQYILIAGGGATPTTSVDAYGQSVYFSRPGAMAMDELGNIYVYEENIHAITRINSTNFARVFAGQNGAGPDPPIDGLGINATFNMLRGMVIDSKGRLFATEFYHRDIRMITW